MRLEIGRHPSLEIGAFTAAFPRPLRELESPPWMTGLLSLEVDAPMRREETVRGAVRDLLRHGGYKPTGRGKPASEYLVRAVGEGKLGSINVAVDACNVVSLHSGLPISVVDLDRATAPFRVTLAESGASYAFNASGQQIEIAGLLSMHDAEGPCANAVKDAQRTKTGDATTRTLSLVWGTNAFPGRAGEAAAWYRRLLQQVGATTTDVELIRF